MFKYTKKLTGLLRVEVDGVTHVDEDGTTGHRDIEQAIEHANRARLSHPTAPVEVKGEYTLTVEFKNAPTVSSGEVGKAFNVAMVPIDPAVATAEGFTKITPLAAGDITLAPTLVP